MISAPRTLLLYPPSNRISRAGLSLPILYTYLKSRQHDITVLDCPGLEMSPEGLLDEVVRLLPHIVGVSVSATEHLQDALFILRRLRQRFPDLLLVTGGIHATLLPETVVKDCDFVVLGWGQETIEDLIRCYPDREAMRRAPGLAYSVNDRILYTESRFTDITHLPPIDWRCIPIEKYLFEMIFEDPKSMSIPIFLSMGCPNRCSFCASKRLYQGQIQYRDYDKVLDEMEINSRRHGVDCFYFYDPCFSAHPSKALAFCRRMKQRGPRVKWMVSCAVNTINPELLSAMAEAGCIALTFGIESCSDYILGKINKSYQNYDRIRWALDLAKDHNMFTAVGIIIGHIFDTLETVYETISKSTALKIDSLGVSLLTPYPGSDDYELALKQGDFIQRDFSDLNCFGVNYIPEKLRGYDLWKCRCFALYHFYSATEERVRYWLWRLRNHPDLEASQRGWWQTHEHHAELDLDYLHDYAVLDPARRRQTGRIFYEPFLPDFSKAHTREFCRKEARL